MSSSPSAAIVQSRRVSPPTVATLLRRVALRPWPVLLDSSGGPPDLASWSFWAFDPFQVLTHDGHACRLTVRLGRTRAAHDNPFAALRGELARRTLPTGDTPTPLRAGAIGFLAYEIGRHVERLPATVRHDIALPHMHWGFYDSVLAVDHRTNTAQAWACDLGGADPGHLLDRWEAILAESTAHNDPAPTNLAPAPSVPLDRLACNFTPASYRAAVARAIQYIAAGDIFQVNLSQRFTVPLACPPVELYLRLREANPAPFAAFLAGGPSSSPGTETPWAVLSSSPERFLRVHGRHVQTRPIKGTRPRRMPGDEAAEAFNRQSLDNLLASPKDAAELAMIVDLERNDLGRVCDYGSIRVSEARTVEPYASVFHTVAQVEGRLHRRYDLVDLLKATFPGGSITGAPKVRAMEIIDELEPTARSVYTGAVGYIGFDGRADLNIAIRTLIADRDSVHLQVGGGIVADSTPEDEYQETLAKGQRMLQTLGVRT
jgi:para-aminobenzoate synthetase component 1